MSKIKTLDNALLKKLGIVEWQLQSRSNKLNEILNKTSEVHTEEFSIATTEKMAKLDKQPLHQATTSATITNMAAQKNASHTAQKEACFNVVWLMYQTNTNCDELQTKMQHSLKWNNLHIICIPHNLDAIVMQPNTHQDELIENLTEDIISCGNNLDIIFISMTTQTEVIPFWLQDIAEDLDIPVLSVPSLEQMKLHKEFKRLFYDKWVSFTSNTKQ